MVDDHPGECGVDGLTETDRGALVDRRSDERMRERDVQIVDVDQPGLHRGQERVGAGAAVDQELTGRHDLAEQAVVVRGRDQHQRPGRGRQLLVA